MYQPTAHLVIIELHLFDDLPICGRHSQLGTHPTAAHGDHAVDGHLSRWMEPEKKEKTWGFTSKTRWGCLELLGIPMKIIPLYDNPIHYHPNNPILGGFP